MQKTVIPEPHKNITFWTRCISVVSHSHRKNKKETVKDTVKKDVKKYTTTQKSVGKKKQKNILCTGQDIHQYKGF